MNKSRLLVLNDLREFTSTIAKKSIFLANKYNKELDVLHIEDESFLRFFKEKNRMFFGKK